MPKYRLRTTAVEAIQFNGQNFEEIFRFAEKVASRNPLDRNLIQIIQLNTETLLCYPGEWVLKEGYNHYVVLPDAVFSARYEEVRTEVKHYDIAWFDQRCRELGLKMTEYRDKLELRSAHQTIVYYLKTGLAGPRGDRPVVCTPEGAVKWAAGML